MDKNLSMTAAVIGSGFGGLSIANRLQALGIRTTLFEKGDSTGGRANQIQERGYTFDTGPSLITAPAIIESIFNSAGRHLNEFLQLIPLDPFYRVYFHDGTFLDYSGDPQSMKKQMGHFNKADAENYDRFMESIRPVYEAVIEDKLGARPFDTVRSMINFAPRAIKLKAYLPVASYARRFFKDFRHQFLFSFHPLFIGGNPFRSPSVYTMIPYLEKKEGVWFTKGGMYSLVKALERLFVEQGGDLKTGHEVEKIVVEDQKAAGVFAGGKLHGTDIVVSNADVAHTYGKLLDSHPRKKWTNTRLDRIDYSMSCFLIYMGVRKTYPQLKHHTLILSRRYRELLVDIFDNKILPDDFSMYLHAPTKTDPEMAPPGSESMYVLVPVANLKSGLDWKKEAEPFADRLIAFLENWALTGLRSNIEVLRFFTPDDFERKYNSILGNAFGIEPRLLQTAFFRPHNRSEEIPNLYLVGAGTHPGAGVPGVLLSAEATEYCIRRDYQLADQVPV